MAYGDPDLKDVLRAIEKLQQQMDDVRAQVKETQRLTSPEKIAQLTGYVLIKTDLKEIKETLASLLRKIR